MAQDLEKWKETEGGLLPTVGPHRRELSYNYYVDKCSCSYLRDLPPPLGGSENVEVALPEVAAQQQDQATVAHEQGIVMPVHLCTENKHETIG